MMSEHFLILYTKTVNVHLNTQVHDLRKSELPPALYSLLKSLGRINSTRIVNLLSQLSPLPQECGVVKQRTLYRVLVLTVTQVEKTPVNSLHTPLEH